MYKIIGGDGKAYGPVEAEQLRRWIAEGRLNASSLAQREGATEWLALGSFPEFVDALQTRERPYQAVPPGAPVPPGVREAWKAEVLARHTQLRIDRCLVGSWNVIRKDPGLILGAVALYWLIETGCQLIPIVGFFYPVIDGVFFGGLSLIYLKRMRGQPASVADLFSGFSDNFLQLLLAGFLVMLLSTLGACCFILPGIYLMVAWILAVPLVADKRLEFWSAMELSRKVVTRVWFEMFALLVITFLPLLILVGFLVAKMTMDIFPAVLDMMRSGSPDIQQLERLIRQSNQSALLYGILIRGLYLIILPFAIGAKMVAYEDLFGARQTPTA